MIKAIKSAAIIGASGAIGRAVIEQLQQRTGVESIYAFSRKSVQFSNDKVESYSLDITDEKSIESAAGQIKQPLDLLLITSGLLHDQQIQPEKSLRDISASAMQAVFAVNTIGPALVAKHFLLRLAKQKPSVFAALSARVGSITDNRLGGWYAYRTSKAALNMLLKNISIELKHRCPQAIVLGLHPGTVDSLLSKPFQTHTPSDKLFSPSLAAQQLLSVIDQVTIEDSGKIIAWDGSAIPY